MITEAEFQAALDADPSDHTTRLVFADWLEEQGDARAEGYRALGRLGLYVSRNTEGKWAWFCVALGGPAMPPRDWYALIAGGNPLASPALHRHSKAFATRREAENAAALAFARLPALRRAELLGIVEVGS